MHTATKDSVNEQQLQQQQLRELYDAEARLRQRFTARLDRASHLATKSPTTLYVYDYYYHFVFTFLNTYC